MIIIGGRLQFISPPACAEFTQYLSRNITFSLPIMMTLTLQGKRGCGLHEYCINPAWRGGRRSISN